MATVTGYTAARMKAIEDSAVIAGVVVGDVLMLNRYDGSQINAGSVRGPQGVPGYPGDASIQIVTSNTRPTNPFIGMMIYETDTHRLYSWNGTIWNLPKNVSGGTLGYVSITNSVSNLGPEVTDIPGMVVTVVVGTARRIRVSVNAFMSYQGNGSWVGTELWEGNTFLTRMSYDIPQFASVHSFVIMTPTPGTHTYRLRGTSNGGTFNIGVGPTVPAMIHVEDIGGV